VNSLFQTLAVALLLSASASSTSAQNFLTERVAVGLDRPVFLTAPEGDFLHAFILEQHAGTIRILRLDDRTLLPTPFLVLNSVPTGEEQGLLGLAFHPDYAVNGFFYVHVTDRVLRFQVSADPLIANVASQQTVLLIPQPGSNHNGGWIEFGPDAALYIATGDGGGNNDDGIGHTPGTGNSQDITDNLLGKILRIDVSGDDFPLDPNRNYAIPPDNPFVNVTGDDEIWAYGLRNPFRASFDRVTNDLYIADVGQGNCEEINVQPAGSPGGDNYGWRLREGTVPTPSGGVGGAAPPGAIDPIVDYPHSLASAGPGPGAGYSGYAVTGGYVYRGPVSELTGRYFFGDFFTSKIWSLIWDGSDPTGFDGSNYQDLVSHQGDPRFVPNVGSIDSIASFGEDAAGNLYVLDLDGEVFYIPEPSRRAQQLGALAALTALARRKRKI